MDQDPDRLTDEEQESFPDGCIAVVALAVCVACCVVVRLIANWLGQ